MTISVQQFKKLQAMQIDVWQRRELTPLASVKNKSSNQPLAINLVQLLNETLFLDIILSIDISSADITIRNNMLDLGIINWQFSKNNEITLHDKLLCTPALSQIALSSTLKKQLWQCLATLNV